MLAEYTMTVRRREWYRKQAEKASKRARAMMRLDTRGWTRRRIGEKYGITGEAVGLIIKREKMRQERLSRTGQEKASLLQRDIDALRKFLLEEKQSLRPDVASAIEHVLEALNRKA